jgi:hypothetical protein
MNESQRRDLQVFDFNQQDQINTDNHLFNKIPNHDSLAHGKMILQKYPNSTVLASFLAEFICL